jgi:hydrogenase expression/formation protein HypE
MSTTTRPRRARVREKQITMAHGAGGGATRTLVEALFLEAFRNPLLEPLEDQAVFDVTGRMAFTTDAHVVRPLFFPGGDIGSLSVNGTVNDLAVSGARPLYLSAAFVLEEGLAVADLSRIVMSMAEAARAAGVSIVTGDTKVVERGKADGCYIATAGVGVIERPVVLGAVRARPGDAVLVSGPIAEHGVAVMLARGELGIEADVRSDTAPLHGLIGALLDAAPSTRCLRDATRGGVGTVLNELASASRTGIIVNETSIPVGNQVRAVCELLGLDPLQVACEGRFVAIVGPDDAGAALAALRSRPDGAQAAIIGRVESEPTGTVLVRTAFGGKRVVLTPTGDPLPRIC